MEPEKKESSGNEMECRKDREEDEILAYLDKWRWILNFKTKQQFIIKKLFAKPRETPG